MFRSLLTTLNVSGNYLGVAQLLPEIGLSCKRIHHRYVNLVQILDTHCSFSWCDIVIVLPLLIGKWDRCPSNQNVTCWSVNTGAEVSIMSRSCFISCPLRNFYLLHKNRVCGGRALVDFRLWFRFIFSSMTIKLLSLKIWETDQNMYTQGPQWMKDLFWVSQSCPVAKSILKNPFLLFILNLQNETNHYF